MALIKLKISKPSLSPVLLRPRLFEELDSALEKPLTWVAAPPGSGKTTLLASYLEARAIEPVWLRMDERDSDIANFFHYMNEAAFALVGSETERLPSYSPAFIRDPTAFSYTYFEALHSLLSRPVIFVLDDFPDFGEKSEIMNVVMNAVAVAPQGSSFVVLSRFMPPSCLNRYLASRQMKILNWSNMRFTHNEIRQLMVFLDPRKEITPDDKTVAMVDGWATAVVLESVAHRAVTDAEFWNAQEPGACFGYFSSEILEKLSDETELFLLKSAFLPWMTVAMCRELTGHPDTFKILQRMHNHCCFTELVNGAEAVYKYHLLFREFLLKKASEILPSLEIYHLNQTAARLLEEAGAVEEAAAIHVNTKSWELLISLVNNHAGSYLRQAREKTVFQWIEVIPKQLESQSYLLAFWRGAAALLEGRKSARDNFTAALKLAQGKDEAIELLAWSGIINSILVAWDDFHKLDPWISWLENHLPLNPDFPSLEVECRVALSMSLALTYRQPHRRELLLAWLGRAHRSASESDDLNLTTKTWVASANYYAWTGDHSMYRMAIEELKKLCSSGQYSSVTTVNILWLDSISQLAINADPVGAIATAAVGLEKSQRYGTRSLNHLFHATTAYASLMTGKLDDADMSLTAMSSCLNSSKRHGYAKLNYLRAWHALLNDDLSAASAHAEQAVRFAEETGLVFGEVFCRLALARVLHEIGEDSRAAEALHKALAQALPTGSDMLLYMCKLWAALFSSATAEHERTSELLKEAFALGRKKGYLSLFWWWLPADMSRLCGIALDRGIESGYAQKLIQQHGLKPPSRVYQSDSWPWVLKIYTMGRFNVVINGVPLTSNGAKVQQKPLALLKAIIAFGGRNVSEEQLVESLWPDADGDIGHQSFATTLHRLRKIIDNDQVLIFSEGKVSLNPLCCWVDAWSFERLANELLDERRGYKDLASQLRYLDKIATLYVGHFLKSDEYQPWAISTRERLRNKLLRIIENAGKLLEKHGMFEEAVTLYQRGVEYDNMIENFYQRLMTCYFSLGNRGAMISIFNSCSAVMKTAGTTPSSKTTHLFEQLLKEK